MGTLLVLLTILIPLSASARQRDTLGTGHPTHFVANIGQWEQPFLFQSQMNNAALFVENTCLTIALRQSIPPEEEGEHFHHSISQQMHAYRVHFEGCNSRPTIMGQDIDAEGGYDNYYYGKDPSRWATKMPHYRAVYYTDLYQGIDMDIRAAQNALKTNFYLAPGASASQITQSHHSHFCG